MVLLVISPLKLCLERSQELAICILWGECWSFYSKEKFLMVYSWILITVLRLAVGHLVSFMLQRIYAIDCAIRISTNAPITPSVLSTGKLLTSLFYLTPFSGTTGGPSPFCAPWVICHKMKCPKFLNC